MKTPAQLDDEFVKTPEGVVSYSYAERVSICVESQMSLQEARRVAAADEQRRGAGWYIPGRK